jgi:hypothetical protein
VTEYEYLLRLPERENIITNLFKGKAVFLPNVIKKVDMQSIAFFDIEVGIESGKER